MTDSELRDLVASFHSERWCSWVEGRYVHVALFVPPIDRDHRDRRLAAFGDYFLVDESRDADWVVERWFATLQFLSDHDLREDLTVAGVRPFESHDPPLTGLQKEWFVEAKAAVRGY